MSTKKPRFRLLTVDEVFDLPDPDWIVEGILPASTLAQLYGDSNVGKTFVALSLAVSVASGMRWLGRHEVRQGLAVYFAAEGHSGIKARLWSLLRYQCIETNEVELFRLVGEPLPLKIAKDVDDLIELLTEKFGDERIALIVLDTFARCTEGMDENMTKEMNLAVQAADRVRRSTGATVLLVHHTGYEGRHARGSTAVKAALGTQIQLTKDRGGNLDLECQKQRDSAAFKPIPLRLLRTEGSLVPVSDEVDSPDRIAVAEQSLSPNQRKALNALQDHPEGLRATEWEAASGLGHSSFYEVRKVLLKRHLVKKEEDRYYPSEALSELVQQSNPPLGGGLVDSEPDVLEKPEPWEVTNRAWEETRDDRKGESPEEVEEVINDVSD